MKIVQKYTSKEKKEKEKLKQYIQNIGPRAEEKFVDCVSSEQLVKYA